MAEFETGASLSLTVPGRELSAVRSQIESALSDIPVGVDASSVSGGGGGGAGREQRRRRQEFRWAQQRTEFAEETVELLEDIKDGIEGGMGGGGGRGGLLGIGAGAAIGSRIGGAGSIFGRVGGMAGAGVGALGGLVTGANAIPANLAAQFADELKLGLGDVDLEDDMGLTAASILPPPSEVQALVSEIESAEFPAFPPFPEPPPQVIRLFGLDGGGGGVTLPDPRTSARVQDIDAEGGLRGLAQINQLRDLQRGRQVTVQAGGTTVDVNAPVDAGDIASAVENAFDVNRLLRDVEQLVDDKVADLESRFNRGLN